MSGYMQVEADTSHQIKQKQVEMITQFDNCAK